MAWPWQGSRDGSTSSGRKAPDRARPSRKYCHSQPPRRMPPVYIDWTGGPPPFNRARHGGVGLGSRVVWSQSGQSPPLRSRRGGAENRQQPDDLGLAPDHRLPQSRRATGSGAVASTSRATTRPLGGIGTGGHPRPAFVSSPEPSGHGHRAPGLTQKQEADHLPLTIPLRGASLDRRGPVAPQRRRR